MTNTCATTYRIPHITCKLIVKTVAAYVDVDKKARHFTSVLREEQHQAQFANQFLASAQGFIEGVILPHETRKRICRSPVMLRDTKLENPWRKHGNIPL